MFFNVQRIWEWGVKKYSKIVIHNSNSVIAETGPEFTDILKWLPSYYPVPYLKYLNYREKLAKHSLMYSTICVVPLLLILNIKNWKPEVDSPI